MRTISLKFSKHPEGDFGRTWKSEAVGIVPQHTQHMHALRPPSEREDDAGDEHITVIDYARPLIDNFLSPGTDAKYITTIDPNDHMHAAHFCFLLADLNVSQETRQSWQNIHVCIGVAAIMHQSGGQAQKAHEFSQHPEGD